MFFRIKSWDVRVYYLFIGMVISGNLIRVGEIRFKNLGVWLIFDILLDKMKINVDFFVIDEEDFVMKYDFNGFRMFRNIC